MTDTPTEQEAKVVLDELPSSNCPVCGRGILRPVSYAVCECGQAALFVATPRYTQNGWVSWLSSSSK